MSDKAASPTPQPHAPESPGFRPGWLTLAGLLIGALAGVLSGDPINALPVLMAAGMALGVGADSLLNWRASAREKGQVRGQGDQHDG